MKFIVSMDAGCSERPPYRINVDLKLRMLRILSVRSPATHSRQIEGLSSWLISTSSWLKVGDSDIKTWLNLVYCTIFSRRVCYSFLLTIHTGVIPLSSNRWIIILPIYDAAAVTMQLLASKSITRSTRHIAESGLIKNDAACSKDISSSRMGKTFLKLVTAN